MQWTHNIQFLSEKKKPTSTIRIIWFDTVPVLILINDIFKLFEEGNNWTSNDNTYYYDGKIRADVNFRDKNVQTLFIIEFRFDCGD